MYARALHGNREVSSSATGESRSGPHREGDEPKPMMHDGEKSDPAIVAQKPANKVEQSAAESVERRAGAEENANQDGTLRTPSRARVSNGLDRVRTAAKSVCRQSSKVGAVCLNRARTDLCGGRAVMRVPTAIVDLIASEGRSAGVMSAHRLAIGT